MKRIVFAAIVLFPLLLVPEADAARRGRAWRPLRGVVRVVRAPGRRWRARRAAGGKAVRGCSGGFCSR